MLPDYIDLASVVSYRFAVMPCECHHQNLHIFYGALNEFDAVFDLCIALVVICQQHYLVDVELAAENYEFL